jgi:hypothetical protein
MRKLIYATVLVGASFLCGISAKAQTKNSSPQPMVVTDLAAYLATPTPMPFTSAKPVAPPNSSPVHAASCVHLAYYFYDNPWLSGNSCGMKYEYCEDPPFTSGCQTDWYNVYAYCGCA